MSHPCPIRRCTTILADSLILCGTHHRLVPQRLALPLQRMKRTCKNSKLLFSVSKEYSDALGAVVAYVNGQVAGVDA